MTKVTVVKITPTSAPERAKACVRPVDQGAAVGIVGAEGDAERHGNTGAVHDPGVPGAHRARLDRGFARLGTMVVHPERVIAPGLVTCMCKMVTIVLQELRQEPVALPR